MYAQSCLKECSDCNDIDDIYGTSVSIIAKTDEAIDIVRMLISQDIPIAMIDIGVTDFTSYYDEYVVTLDESGVWCEPFKRDNNYVNDKSAFTFVSGNCSARVLSHVKSKSAYCYQFSDDEKIVKISEN